MKPFKYIWRIPPIDFWAGATIADHISTQRVLDNMPDDPRNGIVFIAYVPGDTEFIPVYICKGDNNGDTYLFADEDVFGFISRYATCVKP